MADRIVIAGASHAGVAAADALRRQGFAGDLVLLSAETHAPYQRPLMSKAADYLQLASERKNLKADVFYSDNTVDLRLGAEVADIARGNKEVRLADGETLAYDHLVLAIGGQPRNLPPALVSGVPPLYLRSMDDAHLLHRQLGMARSVAVVGGGLIGLEVAALARGMGRAVAVFEAAPNLLGRVVPPDLSRFLLDKHRAAGIEISMSAHLTRIAGDETGYTVEVEGRDANRFDMVLAAIGTLPRTAMARAAGLDCGNGIAVTGSGRTSDPAVWAIGDCADWGALAGIGQRFEGVQPATEQARLVARAILGQGAGDLPIPRYWSHQGPVRLQTAGQLGPEMILVGQAAEDGGLCVLGQVDGVARGCFAVDAPNAYRAALKVLEAVRLAEVAARLHRNM
ncbi:NAD(P)/FAD-dependent oxidoreductase [Devosia sp. Root635]|uniref:NAD(P)/FAD-dependent oxidoreductase n=1 Tax=Devosia sp. Root635 TaxID=1736575 RepID=UPI0006F25C0D|nr:FAD-dependent oxidoreductase [Devosia sp. Root635]KRA44856.1 hypothetical protein ASD80_06900 [Devosia sp. Root635]